MPKKPADPREAMKEAARSMGDAQEGTACTQTSFKAGNKSFFFVGEQGGRLKAMFRLKDSLPQAESMAAATPEDVQVGKHGWVTARFTAEKPMPARVWKKWLKESFSIATGR